MSRPISWRGVCCRVNLQQSDTLLSRRVGPPSTRGLISELELLWHVGSMRSARPSVLMGLFNTQTASMESTNGPHLPSHSFLISRARGGLLRH